MEKAIYKSLSCMLKAILRERGEVATWWVEQSSCTEGGGEMATWWVEQSSCTQGERGGGYLVGGTKQLY